MLQRQPSLRLIMAFSFGLILFLSIALLSVAIQEIAARRIRREAEQTLTIVAQQMAVTLDRSMFERYREIDLIAMTHSLLRSPDPPPEEQRTLLESLQGASANYAWIGLTDVDGMIVAATDGLLEGDDASTRPWFQEALTGPYVGDVHEAVLLLGKLPQLTMADGSVRRFVDISAPVVDSSGKTLGVLSAQVGWSWAFELRRELLQPIADSRGIEVLIVGKQGNVLLGPEELAGTLLPPEVTNVPNGESMALSTIAWPDGSTYLTTHAQTAGYREYPGLGWRIFARQPTSIMLAPVRLLRTQVLLIGLLFMLLGSLVVWLLSGRVTRQLMSITHAANQVREGATNVTIPILDGSREVATLSQALNRLISELTTATTAERNRIARELHDSVTQTLFSASMMADVLPRLWEANPEMGQAKLEELRVAVRGALAEMRTLLLELRPTAVIDAEWPRLLRQLAEATKGRAGVDVDWAIDGDSQLPENVKLTFYRVAQESLNNVAKYANATTATVRLNCQEQSAFLTITDNGQGFELKAITGDHFGLNMMRERVEAIGGELSVRSEQSVGTEVSVGWQQKLLGVAI